MRFRAAAITPTAALALALAIAIAIAIAIAGCTLLAPAMTSDASAAAAAAPSSANQSLARALAAAKAAGSARITVQFFSGSTSGKVVQDSTLRSGKQTVAIKDELASVVLTGGTAYFSGNSKGLTSYFGVPSALVPTLTGRWVSVQSTDSAFQAVSGDVALSSALANVTPSGTLTAGKRSKVAGQSVKSISGAAPGGGGRLTLFVANDAQSLPVEAVETSGSGKSGKGEIVTFTRWGEHVQITTPSGALPLSAIEAPASASG